MHPSLYDEVHDTPEHMDRLAELTAAVAPWRLPLIRAARDGIINVIQPRRHAVIPKPYFEHSQRAIIVVISDDDHAATGPDKWRCARKVKYWGKSAIIHATGGEADHYTLGVIASLAVRRLVFVETDTAHEEAWGKFLTPQMPVLFIRAPANAPHPRAPDRAKVN